MLGKLIYLCLWIVIVTGQENCIRSKLDLVFVVDSSGSIAESDPADGSYTNYGLIKQFMIGIVNRLSIGPDLVQVGVVKFSNEAELEFYLDEYQTKLAIIDNIQGMSYLGGNTNTSGGLRLMREDVFSSENGDRGDANNVAIVITDGVSTWDKNLTIPEAEQARSEGIQIVSVGITDEVDEEELRRISSQPQILNKNYFMSPNFTTLQDLVDSLGLESCVTVPPAPEPCEQADIVFVIDNSGSIRDNNPEDDSYDNYLLLLEFVVDIVSTLKIGSAHTRVGLVSFSDKGKSIFTLNEYTDKRAVITAVRAVDYVGGHTNTSGGLRVMMSEQFNVANGDRPDVQNIAIVITDGESTVDKYRTVTDAEAAHSAGIKIYAIGITNNINVEEVGNISSPPRELNQNYFLSTNFLTLTSIVTAIAQETCGVTASAPSAIGSCIQPLSDLVFLIDSSGSICDDDVEAIRVGGCPNYRLLLGFVSEIIYKVTADINNANHTRVGVVLFSNKAENIMYLNSYSDPAEVINQIGTLKYKGGNTNTSAALRLMRQQQFMEDHGDRLGVKNIAIVITDGESNYDPEDTIPEAEAARAAGIQVYVVGITNEVNVDELRMMSSEPQELNQNYYLSADFNSLSDIVDVLIGRSCPVEVTTELPTVSTMEPEDTGPNLLLFLMLLLAVAVVLTAVRGIIALCQQAAEKDEDKQPMIA